MIAIDSIQEIIETTPNSSIQRGVAAKFIRINENWGLKFYSSEYMRDKTYNLQQIAYDIGRAPELGEKFEITPPDDDTLYGYITECIEKLANDAYPKEYCEDSAMYEDPLYHSLVEDLNKVMWTGDLHEYNCGWLKNGEFVAIDFSHCDFKRMYEDSSY